MSIPFRCICHVALVLAAMLLPASPALAVSPATTLRTGPWGTLKISPINLTAPSPVLNRFAFTPAGNWTFNGEQWPEIEAFLRSAPLPENQLRTLLDPNIRAINVETKDIMLIVPDALRLELSSEARNHLYRRLARYEGNVAHYLPYVISSDAVVEKAHLNPELRQRLAQLEFTRGNRRSLADADLLGPLARDEEELTRLKRLFYTYSALSVELTRDSLQAPELASAYWAYPGQVPGNDWVNRFQRSPDLELIDIARLLPALPRSLLNSFPDGINCPPDANCFWISINFFRQKTNNRLLPFQFETDESQIVMMEELNAHYDRVDPPYRYGDVIAIIETKSDAYSFTHAMVYLADDIVFTKNGSGLFSPFQLSRLDQVVAFYDWSFDLTIQGYRPRRDTPALPALPP